MNVEKKKVLFADDSKTMTGIYEKFIETRGYDVLTINTTNDFFQAVEMYMPDIIFFDTDLMPNPEGALNELKENEQTKNIPIIGTNDDPYEKNYLGGYFKERLARPFGKEAIVKMLTKYAPLD